MWHRSLAWSCLTLLLLGLLGSAAVAQAVPPLPVCQVSHQGHIYPSLTVAQDNVLFAAGEWAATENYIYYLYRSMDRGHTWEHLPDLPLTESYRAKIDLSTNFAADQTLSVTFRTATNISHDGGFTWRVVSLPQAMPNTFALGDAQHLFAGYGYSLPPSNPGAVHISQDGGQTWQSISMGLDVDRIFVSPAFAQDHTVLMSLGAYHYNGGLVLSTDAGLTWQRADTGLDLSGLGIYSLAFSPQFASDRTLFCYDSSAVAWGVYKSTDAAATWQHLPGSQPQFFANSPQLLISPRYHQDQTLWAVDHYIAAIVSRDGGQTWQPATPYPLRIHAAAEYCLPSGVCGVELFGELYEKDPAGGKGKYYLYRSYDYGQTWQCLEDPTPPPGSVPPPPPAEIPEPATWLLLASGVAGLAGWLRRRRC